LFAEIGFEWKEKNSVKKERTPFENSCQKSRCIGTLESRHPIKQEIAEMVECGGVG